MIFTDGMLAAAMGIDIRDVVAVKINGKNERLVLTEDYKLFSAKHSDFLPLRIIIGLEYLVNGKG